MLKNIILILFLFSLFVIQSPTNKCEEIKKTLIVQQNDNQNYTSIQEAIDDANINDIILVEAGIYKENININKSITLIGENKNNTIIDTNYSSFYGIIIKASNVNVSNFTIRNNTVGIYITANKSINNSIIKNNILTNNRGGIYLGNYSNKNIICNNYILGNDGDGIRLYNSYGNEIYQNIVENQNSYGIVLTESSHSNKIFDNIIIRNKNGIGIRRWSNNNSINKNNFSENSNSGILIGFSFYNNFSENLIQGNNLGISISDSSDNKIYANIIQNNQKGIYLYDSINNTISENNIFDNNVEDISEGSKKFKTSCFELTLVIFCLMLLYLRKNYKRI